ncbi:beta-ketoacyl synthase N-terminal-like domain-containing protein [Magnetospirillum gryphiswaldense]|uniref:Beta-ketoacyl synthase n=1 Tax=Magnetospirillum gryphiswaldense TaxID=55518 RepID=A4TWX6_9PROT|nr:beta-ketoacyl synthase N-terminal-like domain-containing protein [Magnetospirillum gryphiswaldense]AVM74068.1 Polyketide biosynthesis malonyl-ACP decarboxylase PksF [Magnetospirillum gryphiswaldense MSR-1]AVM77971.1 Polyketide biosynthesis malonyl-ACP decarboxylase PksF [Magnetospirillum gryphiswaldense]CAM75133.1 beta-ketoacyl synthase [Magnetospirillum gryphiswaldense MSR-1]
MPAPDIVFAGIGTACGLGYGKASLIDGLLAGRDVFSVLARPGRQAPDGSTSFIGVEMPDPPELPPELVPKRVARTIGLGGRVALAVLNEAWGEAALDKVAPDRIGLVVGGSNLFAREQVLMAQDYAGRLSFVPPRAGHVYLDSEVCGLAASIFPIRGFAHTVGAASASGAVAVIQAAQAIRAGTVDVCIALGAMQDVSYLDLLGMRALGAMGSARFADQPGRACRPFDRDHDGFLYGESCAALVLCRADQAGPGYGTLIGAAQVVDGQRGPEPDGDGQRRAITLALRQAGLGAGDIDVISAHATSTPKGDEVEAATLHGLGLDQAWVVATKSVIGHGLSAAGAIELAALLLQMRAGRLHATRNLEHPHEPVLRHVQGLPQTLAVRHGLKLSFGFGGTDTALVIRGAT